MSRSVLFLALAASGLFAQSPRRITVRQLQQLLEWQQSAHVDDSQAARQLVSLRLSERLTALSLDRIDAQFHPGKDASAALDVLADLSAFLSPPAAELLRQQAPDSSRQQKIVASARICAAAATNRLPDFLATRTTRRFADLPVFMPRRSYQSGLYLKGITVRQTAYRDGHEVTSAGELDSAEGQPSASAPNGIDSIGEFGQVLAVIMADSARGSFAWSYWQQSPSGVLAVFHYEVPKAASHYRVNFCCELNSLTHAEGYDGTPAYHGSISIDPSSGAVLRLTLDVDFEGYDPSPVYALLVRYANTAIAGKTAILPVRSATIGEEVAPAKKGKWTSLYLNDVTFTHYRRFGSTVQILPGARHP